MSERDEDVRPREQRGPVRTCAGCGKAGGAEDLVRVVLGPALPKGERVAGAEGGTSGASDASDETTETSEPARGGGAEVAVDLMGGSHGRGAHLHPVRGCLAKAAKGGLARAFKTKIAATEADLAEQIATACDRRIAGLLGGAMRARALAIGADAVNEALKRSDKVTVVVACDAASVVERGPVAEAIAEGRAVAWKDKAALGAVFGRGDVAVVAILNDSVAAQVARARTMAEAVGGRTPARGEACRSREVR